MLGSAEIKTRPIKLAYLVDPNNAAHVREAMRLSSTLWGGVYFPIIPLYKRMPSTWRERPVKAPQAKKVILGYLEAFDPDFLVQFSKEVPAYVTSIGLEIVKPEDIWKRLDEDRSFSPQYGLGIFELLQDIYKEYFKYKSKYPVQVVVPQIPRQLALFWTSVYGELPNNIMPIVKRHYYEALEIVEKDVHAENFDELTSAKVLFPRKITYWGLNAVNRPRFGREACVYFMDGTKVEDVIDFWNLRATGRNVLPLPKQFDASPGFRKAVTEFLVSNRRPWRHDPKVCDVASIIRSRNSTMEEMQAYAKTLKFERKPDDPSSDGFLSLQHWYPRIWDEWARDKDGAVPADIYGEDEESIELSDTKDLSIRFGSLLPKFAEKYGYHSEPRFANEVSFRIYGSDEHLAEVLPKSSGAQFMRAISGLASYRGGWRVGRHGLVKLVRHTHNETRNIPTAESIFFAWLKDLGWKAELSTPGILAKQIYKKLEGFSSTLQNEALLGLLEHMNGGSVKLDGTPVTDNSVGGDREMPVGEVKRRLERSSKHDDLHNYLLSKGIFKLGLRTKCLHCLRSSWFALDAIRDTLSCPRCLNVFPAVGNVDQGTWCYKTAGPFSVPNYADGAYGVLLALQFFSEHKLNTIRATSVLSFTAKAHDKKELEADLAMFWQDSVYGEKTDGILFGECKTYGRFTKKDFDRMRYLARTFPGAVLVFSTLRKTLTRNERADITRIAKAGRKYWKSERPINPVLILTGTELLHWSGPPYCWEDSGQKKFDHLAGLLSVCDATQQIYLGLPSWSTEWHEKWEKRHQRRATQRAVTELHTLDR